MKIIKIANRSSLEDAIKDYTGNRLKGGVSDKKSVEDFPRESIAEGVKVESEHTDDVNLALEITMDHLFEDKDYYKKLKEIEK